MLNLTAEDIVMGSANRAMPFAACGANDHV